MNWYAFGGNDPISFADPSGLVRWGDLGSATLGLVGNGLGFVTGLGLMVIPEPTMLTKVASVVVIGKSCYGLAANGQNFTAALLDMPAPSKGSLANDVAQLVAPGNQNAQKVATIIDLASDLGIGRIGAVAAKNLTGKLVRDANGFPLYDMKYVRYPAPGDLGSIATKFTYVSIVKTAYDSVATASENRK